MSIKVEYTQTTWINETTPLNAQNMNNIDRALSSIKGALDGKDFTASSVGADASGTADAKVDEHNASADAHSQTLAPKVHSHVIANITNFPCNVPTASDDGKVLKVKDGVWGAEKLDIPTKMSELTNDAGYVKRGEVDQPAMVEYSGGDTTTINLEFGYLPDHIVIEDYDGQSETPVATTVIDHNYSQQGVEIIWSDFDVAIVTTIGGPFNVSGHTYKAWAYVLSDASEVPDGNIIVAHNGQWINTRPSDIGIVAVEANPQATATETLTSIEIGDTVYNVAGGGIDVDDAISSTSTNPVENRVIYEQLELKENVSNKVTTVNSNSTNTQYPSARSVYTLVSNRVVANSGTPSESLESLKIGTTTYSVERGTPTLIISADDFQNMALSGENFFRFKVSASDASAIDSAVSGGKSFGIQFRTASTSPTIVQYDVNASWSGSLIGGKVTFVGTAFSFLPTQLTIGASAHAVNLTYDASATYQFEMAITMPLDTISQTASNAVKSSALFTALAAKEDITNKASDFSTINNSRYPTTQAVANYIVANPTLAGTEASLTGLQVGSTKYKVEPGLVEQTGTGTFSTNMTPYLGVFKWRLCGKLLTISIVGATGHDSSIGCTMSGLPSGVTFDAQVTLSRSVASVPTLDDFVACSVTQDSFIPKSSNTTAISVLISDMRGATFSVIVD